jgi:hypothetical protein
VTIRSRGPLISPYLHTPGHPADEPGPPTLPLPAVQRSLAAALLEHLLHVANLSGLGVEHVALKVLSRTCGFVRWLVGSAD